MEFNNTFSIADLVSIVTLATVIIGGVFAFYQWKKNSDLNVIYNKIRKLHY